MFSPQLFANTLIISTWTLYTRYEWRNWSKFKDIRNYPSLKNFFLFSTIFSADRLTTNNVFSYQSSWHRSLLHAVVFKLTFFMWFFCHLFKVLRTVLLLQLFLWPNSHCLLSCAYLTIILFYRRSTLFKSEHNINTVFN